MSDGEAKQSVRAILGDFSGLDSAKELFSELNYDIARDSLSRRDWGKIAGEALAEDPQVIAAHNDFRVIYNRLASDRLRLTQQRAVISTLLREHPYALFLFSTEDQKLWHFVNVKLASGERDDERNRESKKRRLFRRITIRESERRLRTATQRLSMLDLALIQPGLFEEIPPLEIQQQHDKAFDVEEVTKEFYEAYERLFDGLKSNLNGQTGKPRWAHDYALQFLNRLMFLYFVQRKGWLADDDEFLGTFWTAYSKSNEPKDTFIEKWLKVLFFEAFNNQKNLLNTNQRAYMPEQVRKALWEAPYLNGGLFKKNKLDEPAFDFEISDRQFTKIFNLFQKYNFTITEDSPLDQEVAVDPEMIGKVYESLVNLTETGMERSAAGIFYTPRTEIDLMCRLSLVDNLANHLGNEHKNLLCELVFSLDQDEKEQADTNLAKAGLWEDVEGRLNEITMLDPACGSGSFLVGMLYVLNDLLERAETQRGQVAGSYERKKRIIGQSLYGVDVMDWACHVAELRLWLALIVDAELGKEELMNRKEPLLPHFSFKVRCGDSLVQEVGGVDMAHRRGVTELSPNIKRKLTELRNEKTKFYGNDPSCKFKTVEALESQEVLIFRELLQDRIEAFDNQAKKLMRVQAEEQAYQQRSLLTGELEGPSKQFTLERERREKQITALKEETKSLEVVLNSISSRATVPFVWDISFAEIFSGDNHGFDIVIGNPPYVRQENIAAPTLPDGTVVTENKKEYKAKLARSVCKEYQRFFGYSSRAGVEKVAHKLDGKSDLYIYFYFHGLSLLNDKGSFCFITSNSWLDVGYGRDLQEFLLKRCHTKLVIDNKVKRSFKEADVNTVIVLFGTPTESKASDEVSLEKTARFVMFYVPFEEALHPVVFEEIAEAVAKKSTEEYRVFPIKQNELLADGCELPDVKEEEKSRGPLIKTAKYIGNKWGGKYLRAPDFYWELIAKGKDLLIPLSSPLWNLRYGLKTGLTEFFYISKEKRNRWNIEQEFCIPIAHSTREIPFLKLSKVENESFVFVCRYTKKQLKKLKKLYALKYIEWGEKQCTRKGAAHTRAGVFFPNVPSVSGNNPWYSLRDHTIGDFAIPALIRERYQVICNDSRYLVSNMFYQGQIPSHYDKELTWALLNSTLIYFMMEIVGRLNIGGRLNFYGPELSQILIPSPEIIAHSKSCEEIKRTFKLVIQRKVLPVRQEIHTDDRKELDKIIFSLIGLSPNSLDQMYGWLERNCAERLTKEKSV